MYCTFCRIANKDIEVSIIYEDESVMAFLDSEPINEGHVLIIPKEHYLDADEMPKELLLNISEISQKVIKAIKTAYEPSGYSIMQNGGIFNDVGHYHICMFSHVIKNDGFYWCYSDSIFKVSKDVAKMIIENL